MKNIAEHEGKCLYSCDFIAGYEWPADEEAKFKWISSEIQSLNKEGTKVRVKAQIDFIKYHYETECTVRWNENLSETKIKNASITAV